MSNTTLRTLAEVAGGALQGDPDREIERVATVEDAGENDLAFVSHRRYIGKARSSRAGAFLAAEEVALGLPEGAARIVVGDPYDGLRRILCALHPVEAPEPGIHPTAVVAGSAIVDPTAAVGAHAILEAGAVIGSRAVVGAQSFIGAGAAIGPESRIHAQVSIYGGVEIGARCEIQSGARIGSDGYGYTYAGGGHRKIPQVGGCRIGDDVDIGANVTIDRGSIGDTIVGAGTKIDNLVHIGHNVRIGRQVLIVAQVGVSGSTRIGDGAVVGGQAGIAGHIRVGDGARVGAQAGVTADVAPGQSVSGYPARPHRDALRAQAALFRLPEVLAELKREMAAMKRGESQTLDRGDR